MCHVEYDKLNDEYRCRLDANTVLVAEAGHYNDLLAALKKLGFQIKEQTNESSERSGTSNV